MTDPYAIRADEALAFRAAASAGVGVLGYDSTDAYLDDTATASATQPGPDAVRVLLERRGPSYVAHVAELGARLVFRDVRIDREHSADVMVVIDGRHVLRSPSTTIGTLRSRETLAREIGRRDWRPTAVERWGRAVDAVLEAVFLAEEQLTRGVDLRDSSVVPDDALFVAWPLQPAGPSAIVSPGEAGKSTQARALAVSVASGQEIIPGVRPSTVGPVLYVAGEDSGAVWHARSVEAICRGAGIDRGSIAKAVTLLDVRGRKINRIGRAIAERASDHALVIIDSQQSLLPTLDNGGGVRDRDSLFYDNVDEFRRPTLIVAHPNLSAARDWQRADGRMAGSEVNRDRLRMAWRLAWRDEKAVTGTSFRRYTLSCTKWNHGPRPGALGFAAAWTFGTRDDDPGTLRYTASEPFEGTAEPQPQPTKAIAETLEAYRAGATTAEALAARLGLTGEGARQRLSRLRAWASETGEELDS